MEGLKSMDAYIILTFGAVKSFIGKSKNYEVKNWRDDWCDSNKPLLMSQKADSLV